MAIDTEKHRRRLSNEPMSEFVNLKIKRQAGPESKPYWEEFRVRYRPNINVIICLMDIRRNPVNSHGARSTPVVWQQNCLENVCGSCAMLINGDARMACSTLIDEIGAEVTLEPFTKFPVVRDLAIDRGRMFDALGRIKGWIEINGTHDLGPGPRVTPKVQQEAYALSRCMTCGCCFEVCPNINPRNPFIGPAPVALAHYYNLHPSGAAQRDDRLQALIDDGGVMNCSNAQNCVEVCPKGIPLTEAIAKVKRDVTWHGLFAWLRE
jgi:succinate dehydrogenase / fumarate reductase, iron-sulfur subunit